MNDVPEKKILKEAWLEVVKANEALTTDNARLRAVLRGLHDEVRCFAVDPPSAALNYAIEQAIDALAAKDTKP